MDDRLLNVAPSGIVAVLLRMNVDERITVVDWEWDEYDTLCVTETSSVKVSVLVALSVSEEVMELVVVALVESNAEAVEENDLVLLDGRPLNDIVRDGVLQPLELDD